MRFHRLQFLFVLLLCLVAFAARRAFALGSGETNAETSPASGNVITRGSTAPGAAVPPARQRETIVIPRLDAPPKLADFVEDRVGMSASQMLRVTHFVQRYPEDGDPASEDTVAYLGYTHEAFFAAFVCRDLTPGLIRAHMLARDAQGSDDDVFVMLDTFHDQRRAFLFQSNVLGIQSDALYSEQTGYDFSFDTVWDTWGKRTATGYVVLMRIPFASLYFAKTDAGEMRTWGIILGRNIPHTDETDYWPRINHDIAGRLTQDIAVEGFRDVERGENLQLEPYSLARNARQLNSVDPVNPFFQSHALQGYGGLDAKFILHNSLVLDATANPDFSQVGIDNPALPNQRFPPYYAEVRPFFIENSSYFQTPISLYYTDNIVKPQFGARLTGKLGRWAMGVLGVDDRSPGELVPPSDPNVNTRAEFYAARLNRDIGKLSDIGLIYADREYAGSFNRAGGLDYRTRVGKGWTLTGQAVTSQTQNLSNSTPGEQECEGYDLTCSGQAWFQQLSYSDLHWGWWIAYHDTASGFVTDTGFFQRPDVREPNGGISYTFHPASGIILSHGPSLYSERIWDHNELPLDYYLNPSYSISFKGQTSVSGWLELGQDRLRPIDYSALRGNVEYHSDTSGFSFYSSPLTYLTVGGGYYRGTAINYSPPDNHGPDPVDISSPNLNVEVKPFKTIDLENSYVYTHFTDPSTGAVVYDNHQLVSRWNYQLTKAVSFNLIGQYIATLPNAEYTDLVNSKTIFADALFTYMPHPGTAVYFGYIGNFANIDRALCTREAGGICDSNDPILAPTGSSLMNDGKNIYVKVSYLLRF
jgi:hypothetical protein